MSEDLKTIKELAEELGVTKQNIQYHYQRLPKELQIKSRNGSNIINPKAKRIILGKVAKSSKENSGKDQQISSKDDKQLIDRLIEEVKYLKIDKDKIISTKDKQIENLTNLLDQQQRLALQDKKLLEEYKSEINGLKDPEISKQNYIKEQMINESKEVQNEVEKLKSGPKKWWQFWK